MDEAKLRTSLIRAGIRLIGIIGTDEPLIPPMVAARANSCPDAEITQTEFSDPDLLNKSNSDWYRLSLDGRLFNDNQEFLIAVEIATGEQQVVYRWAKVQLTEKWDIMGAGAASGILGLKPGYPGFVMLSLDGRTIVRGDTWQSSMGSIMVRDPNRNELLRREAHQIASGKRLHIDNATRIAAQRWLTANPCS